MATLYIEEYQEITKDGQSREVQAPGALVAKQKKAVGAASGQSSAFNAAAIYVILTSDVPCQVEFGSNPTADGDSRYLPPNVPRAFGVTGGNKLAVIEQQ